MRLTPRKQTLPYESLAQQQLDILLRPVPRGQRLQEHHDLLEIHMQQLRGPLDEKRGADVEVESGEALVFGLSRSQRGDAI